MFSTEIAERLGVSVDTFYRRRPQLHREESMPLPMCSTGRPVWDRSTMEAWFGRFHPARPPQAANDVVDDARSRHRMCQRVIVE